MTLRCKEGDLAVVIHDTPICMNNIGRIVEVRGPVRINAAGHSSWLIRPVNRTLYSVKRGSIFRREIVTWKSRIEHDDAWLLPLRDLDGDDSVDAGSDAESGATGTTTPVTAQAARPAPVPVSSLDYRPRSYFGELDLEGELLTRVKGHLRRKQLRDLIAVGRVADLPEFLTQASLDETDRLMSGRVHPRWMGGEYLPSMRDTEIEIARIGIESTTHDVTCVYARSSGGRIRYRVVDEYEGGTLQKPSTRTSVRPLTMGQLLDFFLGAWDLRVCLDANFENDHAGMLTFFEGESEFYPAFHSALTDRVIEWFPPQD